MSKKIEFQIITPKGTTYSDKIDAVTIDTADGQITIMPEHIPLFAILVPGAVMVHKGQEREHLAIHGGFLEVQKESIVRVLADGAEKAEDLDEAALEEAIKKAEEFKEKSDVNDAEYSRIAALLERDLARLRVVRQKRR